MSRLGIQLTISNKAFIISGVEPNGPAARSNQIFKGDTIEKIDGISVAGKSIEQVLAFRIVYFIPASSLLTRVLSSSREGCRIRAKRHSQHPLRVKERAFFVSIFPLWARLLCLCGRTSSNLYQRVSAILPCFLNTWNVLHRSNHSSRESQGLYAAWH
jgi:hypothetical protein